MIFATLVLAAAACASSHLRLRTLISSTQQSRSRTIPSLDSVKTSFDALLDTLDLPREYVNADKARMGVIDAAFAFETSFHDWFTFPESKGKGYGKAARQKKQLVIQNLNYVIDAMTGAIQKHSWSRDIAEAAEHAQEAISAVDRLLAELHKVRRDASLLTKLGRLIDDESHELDAVLCKGADAWIESLAEGPRNRAKRQMMQQWWKFACELFERWIELTLAVINMRSYVTVGGGARLVGDAQSIAFSPRMRTAVTMAGIIVREIYETSNLSESQRARVLLTWTKIREAFSAANDLYRTASVAYHRGKQEVFYEKLQEQRAATLQFSLMFNTLRDLVSF